MVLWQQILTILPRIIFPLTFLLKTASKSSFFRFGVDIRFWSYKSLQSCVAILLRVATQCLQIAVEWLRQGSSLRQLRAYYYSVFAAESRKSHCNGSVRRGNGALAVEFGDFGKDNFPFTIPFKSLQKLRFSALAWRSCFGAAIRCTSRSACA